MTALRPPPVTCGDFCEWQWAKARRRIRRERFKDTFLWDRSEDFVTSRVRFAQGESLFPMEINSPK
jgi:hypothetical protein